MIKKIIIPIFMILMVVACDTPVPEDLTTKEVFNFKANSRNWVVHTDENGLNRYYSCQFNIKELDLYAYEIVDKGAVIAYVKDNNYQQILPYVRHYENSEGQTWTRTVDFNFTDGKINFFVTNSDFANDPPGDMEFRVILMW